MYDCMISVLIQTCVVRRMHGTMIMCMLPVLKLTTVECFTLKGSMKSNSAADSEIRFHATIQGKAFHSCSMKVTQHKGYR